MVHQNKASKANWLKIFFLCMHVVDFRRVAYILHYALEWVNSEIFTCRARKGAKNHNALKSWCHQVKRHSLILFVLNTIAYFCITAGIKICLCCRNEGNEHDACLCFERMFYENSFEINCNWQEEWTTSSFYHWKYWLSVEVSWPWILIIYERDPALV